jgi:hypothetical protein
MVTWNGLADYHALGCTPVNGHFHVNHLFCSGVHGDFMGSSLIFNGHMECPC